MHKIFDSLIDGDYCENVSIFNSPKTDELHQTDTKVTKVGEEIISSPKVDQSQVSFSKDSASFSVLKEKEKEEIRTLPLPNRQAFFYYEHGFYQGEAEQGIPKGFGFWSGSNNLYFDGYFMKGRFFSGKGRVIWKNAERQNQNPLEYYEGDFLNWKPEGGGRIYDQKGQTKFEGFVKNGQYIWGKANQVRFVKDEKEIGFYTGDIQNDLPNGKGTLLDTNGNVIFEGTFNAGLCMNGRGRISWTINDTKYFFVGLFKDGLLEDENGQLMNDDYQVIFTGKFIKGQPYSGCGMYPYDDQGRCYKGSILNGKAADGTLFDSEGNSIREYKLSDLFCPIESHYPS